jgi:tetratricopeptide (TPR) repeat protein
MAKKKSKKRSSNRQPKANASHGKFSRISLIGSLLFVFALIGALADLSGANSQIREWGQSFGIGLPFPKAKEDEILIIVTNFSGSSDLDAEIRIYRELTERALSDGLTKVRIERLSNQTPLTEQEASNVGLNYGATMVIWGTVDTVGMEPRYTIVRHEEYIPTQPDLGTTLAADFPTFSAYVVEGAPKEYEYLMLVSVGQISYFSRDFQQALSLFSDAINIDLAFESKKFDLETVYYYRGYTYRVLEMMPEALADFTQAININNSDDGFFTARGNIHKEMKNYDAALADHSRAIELKPAEAEYYVNRGNTYDEKGDFEQALQDYNHAINLDPNLALAFMNRGVFYLGQGNEDAAIADFDHAIRLDPQSGFTYFNRGMYYYNLKDLDKAIQDFTNAIENDLDFATAYYYRADSYHGKKNYRAALKDYNTAIELDPEFITAYNNRGNIYHALNDLEAALADFNLAIELDPAYSLAYYNRGAVYDDLGNKAAAIADFRKALELGNLDERAMETAKWRIEELGGIVP